MTTPDIPEDIRAEAQRIVSKRARLSHEWLEDSIALALLSERNRAREEAFEEAAKIADRFTCGLCGMDGKAASKIRTSIREGTKP